MSNSTLMTHGIGLPGHTSGFQHIQEYYTSTMHGIFAI